MSDSVKEESQESVQEESQESDDDDDDDGQPTSEPLWLEELRKDGPKLNEVMEMCTALVVFFNDNIPQIGTYFGWT